MGFHNDEMAASSVLPGQPVSPGTFDTRERISPGCVPPALSAEPNPESTVAAIDATLAQPPLTIDWKQTVWQDESEDDRLVRVLLMAMESGHPGISPESRDTMLGFVRSGRFSHAHYINMWAARLAEMGIRIESDKDAKTQLRELAAAKTAAVAAAMAAAEELAAPKPPPHPRSLRLSLRDEELGHQYNTALDSMVQLLPYATQEEVTRFRSRVRKTMTDRHAYDQLCELISTATKYYGMYRVRIDVIDGTSSEREEFHLTDRTTALKYVRSLWPIFHEGVYENRRKILACGAHDLGNDFNVLMELLIEQLWGADDAAKEAFASAVRRSLADESKFDATLVAMRSDKEEYGYRCVVLNSQRGPQKFHIVDPVKVADLLSQMRQEFMRALDAQTKLDLQGGDADGAYAQYNGAVGDVAADDELEDLQQMMDALAPLRGDALLAVSQEKQEQAHWESRLPSWGGRFLVGDLFAQAAWLREHAAKGDPGLGELAGAVFAAYVLWLVGGFVLGHHWLYLCWKAKERRRAWVQKRNRRQIQGRPPPQHLICGLTGKVMDDPHTVRTTGAKGSVAANTSHFKMFGCDHTFSGQVIVMVHIVSLY